MSNASPLLVHTECPRNAEPTLDALCAEFITSEPQFYIRNHGSVPRIDSAGHHVRVHGLVARELQLSMQDLRRQFTWRTVVATLQCAGNRRAELDRVRPVSGDKWQPGAIGTAQWGGVSLGDVLRAAGVTGTSGLHVAFEALDDAEFEGGQSRFGASIPIEKALAAEVLLALEMNGGPLPLGHGAPLRVVVPGYAGVRSVKWLASIEVRDRPSDNHYQQREYKLFPPDVTEETANWDAAPTIDAMPLNSAICRPADGAMLPPGQVVLRGYAFAYCGALAGVEVSGDGGRSWIEAHLEPSGHAPSDHAPCDHAPCDHAPSDHPPWAWRLWRAELTLPPGPHVLVVRARDDTGRTQDADPAEHWNFKGYLCASAHRIHVTVQT